MGFSTEAALKEIAPSFKFERVGDGLKMKITDLDDTVEIDDKFGGGEVKGVSKFLAIKGEILGCTGGNVDPNTDAVTDVPIGEERTILAQYQNKPLGKENYSDKYSIIAKAIARAVAAAGATKLEIGGELRIKHHELGKRNTEHPEWNRPKLYEATYTPPVKHSSALGGALADDGEPF